MKRKRTPIRLPVLPDDILVNRLVEYGMPRRHAELVRNSVQVRLLATIFYFDVEEAMRGDKRAKERVDYCREGWERSRKFERDVLHNNPDLGAKGISVPKSVFDYERN